MDEASNSKTILEQIRKLRVNKKGERRAPHKPLLFLYAIGQLLRGRRRVSFAEVEKALKPLLLAYAPPVKSRHQPELPYWYLTYDELWKIEGANRLEFQKGGFPKMAGLRNTTAPPSRSYR